jgi:hypothetical protein
VAFYYAHALGGTPRLPPIASKAAGAPKKSSRMLDLLGGVKEELSLVVVLDWQGALNVRCVQRYSICSFIAGV